MFLTPFLWKGSELCSFISFHSYSQCERAICCIKNWKNIKKYPEIQKKHIDRLISLFICFNYSCYMMYKTTSIDVFVYCWWITFFDNNLGIRLYVIYLMATFISIKPPFESEIYIFTARIAFPNNGFFIEVE